MANAGWTPNAPSRARMARAAIEHVTMTIVTPHDGADGCIEGCRTVEMGADTAGGLPTDQRNFDHEAAPDDQRDATPELVSDWEVDAEPPECRADKRNRPGEFRGLEPGWLAVHRRRVENNPGSEPPEQYSVDCCDDE